MPKESHYLTARHFIVPLVFLLLLVFIPVGVKKYYHPLKHTWEVILYSREGNCDWFVRPNKEFFETCWDNPPKVFYPGLKLKDVTYRDDNDPDLRHFVKASY